MDTTVVILVIVLLVILGAFALTQLGSSDSGPSGRVTSAPYSSQQYAGGACGR